MGLEQRGESPSGKPSETSQPHPAGAGLTQFDRALRRIGRLGNSTLGRLISGVAFLGSMTFGSGSLARAEDQPQESTTVVIDGVPVDVSGVQSGGDITSPDQLDPSSELTGQGGGPASPDSGAAEAVSSPNFLQWEDVDKKGNKVTRTFQVIGSPTLPLTSNFSEYLDALNMTRGEAIKQVMHDEDIPQILILAGKTSHLSDFSVGSKGELARKTWAYIDVIVKPEDHPDSVVIILEGNNIDNPLDAQRENALNIGVFGGDLAKAIKMFNNPSVSPNTFVYGDGTRDDATEALAGKLGKLIKPVAIAKEITLPPA